MKVSFYESILFRFLSIIILCGIVSPGNAYEYHWEIDETPEGQESATVVEPIQVTILDEQVEISGYSASLWLMHRYSVHLGTEWSAAHAYKLLQTFESIPQEKNKIHDEDPRVPISLWKLSDRHIQDDIEIEFQGDTKIVTVSEEAFTYAKPLLAEIDGVRGRFFSKRLHRAVVRFVTENATHRHGFIRILKDRYDVSIEVPDYTELTRHTTGEHAGRFAEFKNEELMALVSMLEEFPQGMLKTPGLKYLVRRLDGTPHPLYPGAAAVAWTGTGYIEFMESAFKKQGLDSIHRLILHEKAHFLWAYLFDEQLKQDWIELGGWYENPNDKDGWSTTKQTEFVSAYAHGVNPNEDMAESISFYIVRPDKLRSRSPAKYEFIQNRIMHGTRYISQIREDLTFEVYNLYPDYVYPGRIIRVDLQVDGAPEEDKQIYIEIEIHGESNLDTAHEGFIRLVGKKCFSEYHIRLHPIDANGQYVQAGHVLRGHLTMPRYAPSGYWTPDQIRLRDANGNERHQSQIDFGWKLYIDNLIEDCQPPIYVKNSVRLSLSQEKTEMGNPYQIVHVRWHVTEDNGVKGCVATMNDNNRETYGIGGGGGAVVGVEQTIAQKGSEVHAKIVVPDYRLSGTYSLAYVHTADVVGNIGPVWFIPPENQSLIGENDQFVLDEGPYTIEIHTRFPDDTPPVLDLNQITINAEPTRPEDPNGETLVDIAFRVKDDISGYSSSKILLRDPQGVMHQYNHSAPDHNYMYSIGDPTVNKHYQLNITLPVGSVPGRWGLAEMTVFDKAGNTQRANFTEIVRFEVKDVSAYTKPDINEDGKIDILDLIFIAQAFEDYNEKADVNGDGIVDILDLSYAASHLNEENVAAPTANGPTADQIQSWITQAMQADDDSPVFRRGIRVLQNLLLTMRPETTVLLPNYPNPFNPETWIPYHLSKPAEVTLTIYGANGSVVRTLALGHQSAGIYQSRSRAAFWDGKNAVGEGVASGIYFYTLSAGDFSATRKMLILK